MGLMTHNWSGKGCLCLPFLGCAPGSSSRVGMQVWCAALERSHAGAVSSLLDARSACVRP